MRVGNSIEEDIRNAEHFIKSIKTNKEYKEENGWHGYYNKKIVEFARILQHILSDYKRVLKENEELKDFKKQVTDIESTNFIKYKNYIPIQKVKDKIEEEKIPLTIVGGRKNKKTLEYGIKLGRRQALRELIEERED